MGVASGPVNFSWEVGNYVIGTLTICSAGFNHLVAVVKMGNWLISFNVYI